MPYEFTEQDFEPKSKFDFTEEDFKPKEEAPLPPVNPTANPLMSRAIDTLSSAATSVAKEFNPFKPRSLIETLTGGALPVPASLSKPLTKVPTAVWETLPFIEAAQKYGSPKIKAVATGIEQAGTDLASFFTSPVGIATLGIGSLPAAAQKATALAFSAQMAKDVPEIAKQLGEELGKSEDQRDYTKISKLTANAIANTGFAALGAAHGLSPEPKPAAETAQPKEENASTVEAPAEVHGSLLSQPVEGKGQVPVKEGESRVQPQTEGGIPKEEVGPHPTAEQLVSMTPDEVVAWKNRNRYGMNFDPKAGTTSVEIAEKLSPEDIPKLEAERDKLRADFKKEYNEALKSNDTERLGKTLPTQLKSQTLDEIIADYHEGAANQDYVQYQRLVRELKRAPVEERFKMSKEIEQIKNKYVGKPPPRDLPKPQVPEPEPTETVLAARGGTAHGLPAGVPDRGPNFSSELMEASRQLGALVRSRSTLRPGVLGQFVRSKLAGIKQADRIEVGDIRNQATVAHEIGHSLDGILFPDQDFGNSQESLAARVGTGTKKELTQELTKVSELMRGPMTGSAGHVQYRKRATELIADWVSLYLHDPGRAWKLAPKFSSGFAKAVAKNDEVHSLVSQLIAGDVTPRPPNPTLPKALAGITGAPPQGTAAMPGKMPARPILPPPVRERQAAVAAEGLVKDAVRTLESKTQSLRILGENWIKDVPKESDRLDVGAFVEGMGNLSKPGDTIDRVRTRMTPAKEQLVKKYRFRQELQRQEINSYLKDTEEGEYLKFLEDYLPHFYVDSEQKIGAAASRFSKESPHAKQRKLPTLKEATDLGLTPITQDPAVLIQLSGRINWQVATNRKFVAKLKDLKTASGGDVVVPKKDNPGNWPTTDNPLIQRVYARQTPNGLMLWRGGAAIHPDVWRAARQILEAPVSGDIGKAYDAINSFTRANAFAFSLFHDLTLRSAAIGSQATAKNPLRGLFRVMEQHPLTGELKIFQSTRGLGKELLKNEEAVADAAQHGLKFSYTDSEAYQHNARTFLERRAAQFRDVPVLGKTARLARDLQQWRQEGLWKNTHDAFKIITYHDLVSKALQDAPPGTDTSAVKEQIASFLNDAYGGQEWQTKFWLDPATRKIVSRFLLAPDWTLSTLRSVPGLSDVASTAREQAPRLAGRETFPTPKEGIEGAGKRLQFWGTEVAALAMATAAAQYVIYKSFGDDKKGDKAFPWDNELNQKMRIDVTPITRKFPWSDPKDPTRHYVNLGKRPQEILNWFTEPDKQIMSKSSRPVAMIFEQVAGSEGDFKAQWKQDHESFLESVGSRAKAIGTEALPFTFRGNQFALSAPVRKGMTKYKAQQAYESVFELATNPSRIRSLLRGQPPSEGTIPEMASQITDAAHRNGVPAEEVMVRALSTVRGHHYNEFFKAFQKGDQKKMDEEAKALMVLGATDKGIEESLKRRMELQPQAQ